MNLGPAVFFKSIPAGRVEKNVLYELDYSQRHEIALGGQILTGNPTVDVVNEAEGLSGDIGIAGIAIDPTGKKVQWKATDQGAVAGNTYTFICTVQLSSGEQLVTGLDVNVIAT